MTCDYILPANLPYAPTPYACPAATAPWVVTLHGATPRTERYCDKHVRTVREMYDRDPTLLATYTDERLPTL